jgi:hypothetical protein
VKKISSQTKVPYITGKYIDIMVNIRNGTSRKTDLVLESGIPVTINEKLIPFG